MTRCILIFASKKLTMRKAPVRDNILLSIFLLCTAGRCLGQIHIGNSTTWISTNETTVVLDDMDLKYDAAPTLLNNIFRFTGTRGNSIGGGSRPVIYAISLAKTNPGMLILNQAIDVTKRINFEAGLLNLNKQHISLGPNALLTKEHEESRLIGPGGGYIDINTDLHAPVAANPGNLGVVITAATDLGKVNIFRSHDLQYINDSSKSIARWAGVSVPDNIAPFSVSLRFNYFYVESEGFQPDSLVVWQSGDGPQWSSIGYSTRDASQKYVEKQGLTRLSNFTLYPGPPASAPPPPSTPGNILLTGDWAGNFVSLKWSVSSEYQTDHFTIERKYAGDSAFTAIIVMPTKAAGGTSTSPTNYSSIDSTVTRGLEDVSYRIHEIGTSIQSVYSNIITLKAIGAKEFIHKLYPTIATGGRVYIQVGNMLLLQMTFMIVDSKGSIILTGTLPYQSQWLPVNFLSHGHYHLVLRSGDQKFHSTFIK